MISAGARPFFPASCAAIADPPSIFAQRSAACCRLSSACGCSTTRLERESLFAPTNARALERRGELTSSSSILPQTAAARSASSLSSSDQSTTSVRPRFPPPPPLGTEPPGCCRHQVARKRRAAVRAPLEPRDLAQQRATGTALGGPDTGAGVLCGVWGREGAEVDDAGSLSLFSLGARLVVLSRFLLRLPFARRRRLCSFLQCGSH